jgi:hypothetical protein
VHEIDIPANDDCANAFELALSDECELLPFSSVYTTSEGTDIAEDPACGFFQGGDVWFKFLSPETGQFSINRNNLSGSSVYELYSGTCGDFTQITCSSESETSFNDPSIGGQFLYLRVFGFNSIQGGDFELCVVTTEVAENDNCADAIPLAVNEGCIFESFNNFNTTSESEIPLPSCGFFDDGDVWFSFVLPDDGKLSVELSSPAGFSFNSTVYSGTCGDLTELSCFSENDDLVIDQPDLGGEELLLRVFRFNNNIGAEFDICLSISSDIAGDIDWNGDCGSRSGTIKLYDTGTSSLQGEYSIEVDQNGFFEVATLESGVFDLYIKVDGFLQKVIEGVNLNIGPNEISFPSLIPGDISGNNTVGIQDFSNFSATYGSSSGDASFNPLADMNCDGEINIQDFSTFSSNYGLDGDAP